MLDLQVVANRANDQIVFNQACHKRRSTIRIAEVDSRAGAFDDIVAYYPVPGGAFGGNGNGLLIIAMSAYA